MVYIVMAEEGVRFQL
jgi:hypothetical protein